MDDLARMMEAIAHAERDDVMPEVGELPLDARHRLAGELYQRGWATAHTFNGPKVAAGQVLRLTADGEAELQRRLDAQDDGLPASPAMTIAERIRRRSDYLVELYAGTNGSLSTAVSSAEVGTRLQWTDPETRVIAKDLQAEELIVFRGSGPIVCLAPKGKAAAEAEFLRRQASTEPRAEADHRRVMARAVELARKCLSEEGKTSPRVAAIVVRDGEIVGEAFRAELERGEHAEFTLLERKLAEEPLAGATLYTTLEPCTSRNPPKLPCVERIVERRIRRVVIGMIDPNDAIRGRGELRLRAAGIEVTRFDPEYMAELEEMNREFIRDQTGPRQVERDPEQIAEPAPDEIGPNGHRVGYSDAGDKVEWVRDPDAEGGEVPIILRRNDAALLAAYNEAWDKVWWHRHQALKARVESGDKPLSEARAEAFAKGEAAAAQIESTYGRENLECDEFELGLLNGRLSALAWVLGAEWNESLDT